MQQGVIGNAKDFIAKLFKVSGSDLVLGLIGFDQVMASIGFDDDFVGEDEVGYIRGNDNLELVGDFQGFQEADQGNFSKGWIKAQAVGVVLDGVSGSLRGCFGQGAVTLSHAGWLVAQGDGSASAFLHLAIPRLQDSLVVLIHGIIGIRELFSKLSFKLASRLR